MSAPYLPDVNVLIALSLDNHVQHAAAKAWSEEYQPTGMAVCRVVQLSFLRLLTTSSLMGPKTITNREAWDFFDHLTGRGMIRLVQEPVLLHHQFREKSMLERSAPKRWNDAYLSAFATAADLQLVTFDRVLAGYTPRSILLHA